MFSIIIIFNSIKLLKVTKKLQKCIFFTVKIWTNQLKNAIIVLKPSKYVSDMLHIGREKEITILRIVKSINYEYK